MMFNDWIDFCNGPKSREGLLTVIKNDSLWNFPTNHQIGFQR